MTTKQKAVVKTKPKKANIKQKVLTVFQWATKEFEKAEELLLKRKSTIILETAKKLEDLGIEKSTIANEITKNLSGFVDDGYVLRILKDYPQYKDKKQSDNAKSGSLKRAKQKKESQKQEQQEQQQQHYEAPSGDDNAPTGYYEMPVKDFKIKDIQLYDRQYLLEIVVHLFERLPEEVQKEYQ